MTPPAQTATIRPRLALVLAALVLRAVIPLGYMPGNLLAGEFMILCPTGLPAGFALPGEHHHHADDVPMVDAERACPIGAALQQAALPADHNPAPTIERFPDTGFAPAAAPVFVNPPTRYHSRAPPLLS